MVTSVTSLGRSGLHDWVVQRVSALVMLAYVIYLAYFLFTTPELSFSAWQGLFASTFMKIFSLLALLSVVTHAWIGLWIVSTDYMPKLAIRVTFQVLVILICLSLLVWGIQILWSL